MKRKKTFLSILLALCLIGLNPMSLPCFDVVQNVEAASTVRLSKSSAILIKGQMLQLKVTGTKSKVKWYTSKSSIATVSQSGKVTAKNKGIAVITAKIGRKKYNCKITVETPKISKRYIKISVGKTYQLKVSGTKQKIKWISSNKRVATVNNKGFVIAKSIGVANIYANIGNIKIICKVNVKSKRITPSPTPSPTPTPTPSPTPSPTPTPTPSPTPTPTPIVVDEIYFEENEITMRVDQTYKLNLKFNPDNVVLDDTVNWQTNNSDIASVDNGIIYPKNIGTCVITAKYKALEAICTVTVEPDKVTLKQIAKKEYDEKVLKINNNFDESINSCKAKILDLKREGYYTGTQSQYNSQVKSLSNAISKLQMQSNALAGSSDSSNKAQKARIDAEISKKQAELDELQKKHSNTLIIEGQEELIREFQKGKQSSLDSAYKEYQEKLEEIDNLY
jgi:hypothetical protein